jgi:putative hemolysin
MKKLLMFSLPIILLSCTTTNPTSKMANPASEFCIKNNGVLDIRKDDKGNESGICVFNQNNVKSECEEWAFFRGECKPK